MKSTIHELQKSDSNIVSKTNSKNSRKNNYSLVVAALLIISVLNFSCSKPENGTNGTNGLDGKNGTNGEVGSANVIYGEWAPVNFPANFGGYSTSRQPIQLTQQVVDSGIVLVYLKINSNPTDILSLGYYQSPQNFASYKLSVGLITINGFYTNINAQVLSFRYVIIPGGVPSGRGITKPDYKNMTYSQVCAKFNIPE